MASSHARLFSEMSDHTAAGSRGQPGPNPKRRKLTNTNARFDRMIETMSIVHSHPSSTSPSPTTRRKKIRRKSAYSPPEPAHLENKLSLIKMDRSAPLSERPSSDSIDTKGSEIASSWRTCNPLPSWLANTFMTLSRSHPLRLLLPKGTEQGTEQIPSDESSAPVEDDPMNSDGDDSPFASAVSNQVLEGDFVNDTKNLQMAPFECDMEYLINPENEHPFPNFSHPIPFSTPGPVSAVNSSVVSNTLFSIPSPQTCSSPTFCSTESRSDPDLPFARPYTPVCNTPAVQLPKYSGSARNDATFNLPLSPAEAAHNRYFSRLYSTPGPGYRASSPEHFDSPIEDPLTSQFLVPGFNADDVVDFQWRPFDRNNIVVPSIAKGVAFARSPSKGQRSTDNLLLTLHDRHSSPPKVTRSTGTPPKSPFPQPSPSRRYSPCPFRFLPPPESAPAASIVPAAQEPLRALTTPKMPPFAPVPGIYISPLQRQQTAEPSPRVRLTVNGTSKSPSRDPVNSSGAVEVMAPTPPPVRCGVDHEVDHQRRTMSQSSNDSIESWDDKEGV